MVDVLSFEDSARMANVIDAEASVGNKSCKKLIEASKCKSMTEWMLLKKGLESRIPVHFYDEDHKFLSEVLVWPILGKQTIRQGDSEYEIVIGELSDTSTNPYERLGHLGHYATTNSEHSEETKEALKAFQEPLDLQSEQRDLSRETKDKIQKVYR